MNTGRYREPVEAASYHVEYLQGGKWTPAPNTSTASRRLAVCYRDVLACEDMGVLHRIVNQHGGVEGAPIVYMPTPVKVVEREWL